jgi:DNA (cytosine-5)-methyltransferase 1
MYQGSLLTIQDVISHCSSVHWTNAGMMLNGFLWTVDSSESRNAAAATSLQAILEAPEAVPSRFSLSPKAAQGILRRAAKRGRTLPDALQTALEALADTPAPAKVGGQTT